jgi:hypothetical protein
MHVPWSLIGGLGLQAPAGTYTVRVYAVDAAGNWSPTGLVTIAVLAPGYQLPTTYLPLMSR